MTKVLVERELMQRLVVNLEILNKRPRPLCRDCADCDGVCTNDGLNCDMAALLDVAGEALAQPAQTGDEPEVAAWGSFYKGVMQDFGYNREATEASAKLDFHGRTLTIEPLIRLSDYRAKVVELEAALAESRANDRTAMGYLFEIRKVVGGDDFPDMVQKIKARNP